jgi:Holliday junction resolvase
MPIKTYAKGARHERDLMYILNHRGFACVRSASSGGWFTPADIIAIKKGIVLAIESKAWSKMPKLASDKVDKFRDWCDRASAIGFLAWRPPNEKWKFLRISDAAEGNYLDEHWMDMEDALGVFDI